MASRRPDAEVDALQGGWYHFFLDMEDEMPEIPAGSFDAARIADELYGNDDVRSPFFAAAYELFPDYNDEQLDDAADYIMDRFANEYSERYTESEWEKISEQLYDHIIGGLS